MEKSEAVLVAFPPFHTLLALSFSSKKERKKERKIPRLPPPFFLACLYGRSHMDASSSFIPKSIPLKIFVDIVKHLELIISSVFRGHVI